MRSVRTNGGQTVTALDLGSARISCLIARVGASNAAADGGPPIEVLALSHSRSKGLAGCVVTDLDEAQETVRAAVAQAERLARRRVDEVHVAVNSPCPRSITFRGSISLPTGQVTERDVAVLQHGAMEYATRDGSSVVSLTTYRYSLDDQSAGARPINRPLGLSGRRLHGFHHAITLDASHLQNIRALLQSCHLDIASVVPAAAASAIAVTSEVERGLGTTVIDLGSQLTSVASYLDGHLVYCDAIPVGGQHLTMDIARWLGCPLAEAERIKTLYGSLLTIASDEHQYLPVSGDSGCSPGSFSRAELVRVVQSRFRQLLAAVQSRIAAFGQAGRISSNFVLTGGASQLVGTMEYVSQQTGWQIRAESQVDSAWGRQVVGHAASNACVFGLVRSVSFGHQWLPPQVVIGDGERGYLGRMERWLRDSF